LVIVGNRWSAEDLGLPGLCMNMAWKKVTLQTESRRLETVVEGKCNHCNECCICWIYDQSDQPADRPPRKGLCPHLDLKTKACRVWQDLPEGCRSYPTVRDFELGCVPDNCGFRLAKGGKQDG
jgi:uncharacterized cysteine cluster protein YcgN (CxxCxxCC family)